MAKKAEQPALTIAEVEILKQRIGNMTPEEQKVVAEKLNTSIILEELSLRLPEMSMAINLAAEDLRGVQKAWLK